MCNFTLRRILSAILAIIIVTLMCGNVFADEADKEYTFCEVLIEASGCAVIESVNGDVPVPVGTMSKLMTVLLTAEKIEAGELSVDDKLKTSQNANSMQGAQIWLMPGEEITVDELLKGVIIGNANDASVVLAEKIGGDTEKFTELMNLRAKELGMVNTVFTNCNGYYDDADQISTAIDLAKLCAELSRYELLREYLTCWRDFVRDGETELVNANELVKDYNGIIGFKAGYTENSGYFAAAGAERGGATYISVVLGCSDKYDSFTEAKRLMNIGFSGYTVFVPDLPQKDIPQSVAVKGGMARRTTVKCGSVRSVVLPKGAVDTLSASVIVPDYVYAPVKKGDKIGEVHFSRDGKILFAVDITAAEPVEKINILKAMGIILKNLLTF